MSKKTTVAEPWATEESKGRVNVVIEEVVPMAEAEAYIRDILPDRQLEKPNGKLLLQTIRTSPHTHLVHATTKLGEILVPFSEESISFKFHLSAPEKAISWPLTLTWNIANDIGKAAAKRNGWDWNGCSKIEKAPARPSPVSARDDEEVKAPRRKKEFHATAKDRPEFGILKKVIPISEAEIAATPEEEVPNLLAKLVKEAAVSNPYKLLEVAGSKRIQTQMARFPAAFGGGEASYTTAELSDNAIPRSVSGPGQLFYTKENLKGVNVTYKQFLADIYGSLPRCNKKKDDWISSWKPSKGGLGMWIAKGVSIAIRRMNVEEERIYTTPTEQIDEYHFNDLTPSYTADEICERRLAELRECLEKASTVTSSQAIRVIRLVTRAGERFTLTEELKDDIFRAKRAYTLRRLAPEIKERFATFCTVGLKRQEVALKFIKKMIEKWSLSEFASDYERSVQLHARAKRIDRLQKRIALVAKADAPERIDALLEIKAEAEKEGYSELSEALEAAMNIGSLDKAADDVLPANVVPFRAPESAKLGQATSAPRRQPGVSNIFRSFDWDRNTHHKLRRELPRIRVPTRTFLRDPCFFGYAESHFPHGPDPPWAYSSS
jgi:translation initiation factor 1 (eIF-1/SUI1)